MSDFVQTVIVTLAAGAALVMLVWPYVATRKPSPGCANCSGGSTPRRAVTTKSRSV